jgi:hypothetical protein
MNHELFSPGFLGNYFSSRVRRAIFCAMIVWLPPVIAVMVNILSGGKSPQIGLFQDFAFHVRCLIAVPLLVLVEKYIFRYANFAIRYTMDQSVFESYKLAELEKLRKIIYKLQSSLWIEAVLLLCSLAIIYTHSYLDLESETSSWRSMTTPLYHFAKTWNKWIGLTIYYYFILRWILKFLLWCTFLIKFSLLKPHLESFHPDQMGGISYLSKTQVLFGGFTSAFSAVSMANISSSILYGKMPLEVFYLPLVLYGTITAFFFLAPLGVFTPHLLDAKRNGKHEYAVLFSNYSTSFKKRWFNKTQDDLENLLGTLDIQSMNDLMSSYSGIKNMKVFAMDHHLFLVLLLFIAAPLLPLLFFKINFN